METNIPEIAKAIFGGNPKPTLSVQLGLEDCAPADATPTEQAKILSEILMVMFLEGIKVRYGEDKRPESLTTQQIQALSDYVRSYGFYIIVKSDMLTESPAIPDFPRTELKHFHERFYDFDRKLWHEVAFDFVSVINDVPSISQRMVNKKI